MTPGARSLLHAPVFDDPDATRAAAVLHWMLFSVLATLLVILPTSLVLWPGRPIIWSSYGVIFPATVAGLALVRRGQLRAVGVAFPVVCWLVVTSTLLVDGGIRATGLIAYPAVLLIAGIVWSSRAALGFAALSSAATLLVWWLGAQGLLEQPEAPPEPGRVWVAVTVVMIVTGAVLNLALRAIRDAIAEARRNERKFAELIEQAPDAIGLLDAAGRIESANPAAERLAGRALSELVGRSATDLAMLGPGKLAMVEAAIKQTLAGSETPPFEVTGQRPDGSSVHVEVLLRRIDRADGSFGIQVTGRDRTEQRLAEQERKNLEQQLVQSQKLEAVGQLAGGVAHDFNNYLTVILGNANVLEDALPKDDPLLGTVAEIEAAANRSAELTRQLLAFSRRQILQPRVIDLNQIVADAHLLLERLLGEDIEIATSCADELWRVRADPVQLETLLVNLAVNARDAMPTGGRLRISTGNVELGPDFVRLHPEVEAGEYVVLEVEDDGRGMDAETVERIFEPFFTTKHSGTGLGLSTLYGIVRQSEGTVAVESSPDEGTSFRVYLPRVAERLTDDAVAPAGRADPSGGSETILLVEDEPRVRALATAILEGRGYRVLEAASGHEAMRIADATSESIDLLLTDVTMPSMSGPELVLELNRKRPGLPVLYMSGYPDRGGDAPGNLAPDAGLLQKPFTVRELLGRARRALDATAPG